MSTVAERTDDDVVEQARIDGRPRWRRMAAPVGTGAGVLAASAYVFAIDPEQPGHYPLCPTQWLLGIDCPACGMLRGTHDLLHGDVSAAADHNILIFALYPVLIVLWALWMRQAWRGYRPALTRGQARRRDRALILVLVVILAFGVIRWFVPYLGSGAAGG